MSSTKSKAPVYTEPLIFPPLLDHKQTIIILHGRGSTAEKFATPLLEQVVPVASTSTTANQDSPGEPTEKFRDHFPNAKLVFPTAPLRRAVVFKRSLTHQWFDNWSLKQPELKQHLQIQGLRETSIYIHKLLHTEIAEVGSKNVVLMGLSQGCAASLVSTLLWTSEAFGAVVGMCGYLPFRKGMSNFALENDNDDKDMLVGLGEDEDDIFEKVDEPSESKTKIDKAVEWLREELQTEDDSVGAIEPHPIQSIPVFMGHGTVDEKVPIEFGSLASQFLRNMDVGVTWNEYSDLGHWYSTDMLLDVIKFLKSLEGWGDGS